jgi:hypothetical protein
MITNGRIPSMDEMSTDEYGLRSMSDIDLVDLRISFRQWELQGLVPSGKALDHVSMYGTDLSGEENTENMYRMFVSLPAEVITQGMSMIHENSPNSFAQNTSMANRIKRVDLWLYCNHVLSRFKIVVFGLLMSYQDSSW